MFTLMPMETIANIMADHAKDESLRSAQKVLASEVTDLVHGLGAGDRAKIMSSVMFSSSAETLTSSEILAVFRAENMLQTLTKAQVVSASWRDVVAEMTKKSKCK